MTRWLEFFSARLLRKSWLKPLPTEPCLRRNLFRFLQRFDVFFQRAGVLALGFEIGLELFDEALEAQNLEFEFLHVHAGGSGWSSGASWRGGRRSSGCRWRWSGSSSDGGSGWRHGSRSGNNRGLSEGGGERRGRSGCRGGSLRRRWRLYGGGSGGTARGRAIGRQSCGTEDAAERGGGCGRGSGRGRGPRVPRSSK